MVYKKNFIAVAKIKFGAMATSGTYLNYFHNNGKEYSHLIDPRTGWPVEKNLVSVSVLAPNCIIADALGTTAMVLGEFEFNKLIKNWPNTSALFVYKTKTKGISISNIKNFPCQ